jgi:thiosulfate dehydrogenase (quinone) large subunit
MASYDSWRDRFSISGWALLPLRLFLGFTFLYAGLLKLTDPNYLDASSPNSMQSQLSHAIRTSPISGLLSHTLEHASFFGILIALGEVAAGLSLLLGLWTRLGALGGFLLSLSFLLTVSWGTTPYFFGPDIVFMFACIPLMLAGDGGVWSVQEAIRQRMYRDNLPPKPIDQIAPADVAAVDRRVVLRTAGVAAGAGLIALAVGAVTRAFNGNSQPIASPTTSPSAAPTNSATSAPTSAAPSPSTAASSGAAAGTKVATTGDVKVGSAFAYTAPDGNPAYIVQPKAGTYLSYSRVCTHEGCTVDFTGQDFQCPCHGAVFTEDTGECIAGPGQGPLQKYTVTTSGQDLYVV